MKDQNQNTHQPVHNPSSDHIQLPKRDRAKTIWIVVAIIAIAALIGLAAFGYVKVKNLNKQISDQQSQINELNNTKKTLEDAAAAAASAAAAAATKSAINTVTTSGTTDTALIEATKNHYMRNPNIKTVNATVQDKSGDFAHVSVNFGEPGTSRTAIFKKVNNTWQYIYGGTQAPCSDYAALYGLPSGWYMVEKCTTTPD
ncbi:MAG: hypothetical protein U0516_01115 [Candidatus Saccharibacteria bacterium]